ncbi:lipopolysaccharide biosynthesis protein [uncultured Winogradskyella sp.]|uniref:lipopolysaccharide biosynthesis protein n=1 Tax=uncultured Winogradskyella sp. TaxID=395353 RepID=UPI0035113451
MSKSNKIVDFDSKDLGRKSVRSGMVNMGGQLLSVIIQLTSTVVLARIISPDSYGIIGMVMAVIIFAGLFRDLGLSTATIQRKEINSNQISVLFWVNAAVGLGLSVLLAFCSPLVVWFYGKPELLWVTVVLGINIFLSSLGAQHAALLNRHMQFVKFNVAKISSALTYFIVALIGALYGMEYWALVLGAVAQTIVNTALVWFFSGWIPGLPQRNTGSRDLIKYGLNLTGFEFVNYFSRNLDNVLIGKVIGAEVLGYYTRAYRLIMFPISNIRTPLAAVALPGLSSIQSEKLLFRSYYTQLLGILSVVTMPIAAFTFFAAEPIVLVVLGLDWLPVAPIMQWLAVAAFLQPVAGLFGVVLLALGLAKRHMHCGLISGIVLSLVFLISVNYGVEVLAMAYAISGYVLFIPIFLYASKNTGINLSDFYKGVWRAALASIISVIILSFIDFADYFDNIYLSVFIKAFEFIITYLAFILILPGGKTLLLMIVNRIRQSLLKPTS